MWNFTDWQGFTNYCASTNWYSCYSHCNSADSSWTSFSNVVYEGIVNFVPSSLKRKPKRVYPSKTIYKLITKKSTRGNVSANSLLKQIT